LQDSGRDAIQTVQDVVTDLHRFVRAARIPAQPTAGLPPGYRTPRVQRALQLLEESLHATQSLAARITPPTLP
jgi:hypothetical protein